MPAKQVEFSFIVLTFNSARYISQCLAALAETVSTLGASAELFIIDNGSVDETRSLIREFVLPEAVALKLIEFDHNTGTTYSRNQALAQATGEYVVVLDSDAYLNAAALQGLRGFLRDNPGCGMAVPRLTYPDGRWQMSTDVFPGLLRKIQRFLFLKDIEAKQGENLASGAVDYAISACWVMPARAVEAVGLLDEKIFYAPEDVDYCIRIWKAGFSIHYLPELAVVHDAQEISRAKGFRINWFTLSHIKGLAYLYLKHRFLFSGSKFRHEARPARAQGET